MEAMLLQPEKYDDQWHALDARTKWALMLVASELQSAERKHPRWPDDRIHAAAIVAEEAGELVRAALQHHYEKGEHVAIREEALHTAATAVRMIKNL